MVNSERSVPDNIDISEQRIRQYHNKVLSAISASAQKKQLEQQNILDTLQRQRQHPTPSQD